MTNKMPVANSLLRNRVSRKLHWCLVFSVFMTYTTAYYRYWYTSQSEVTNWYLLVIHINFGILVLVLTVVMLAYRMLKRSAHVTISSVLAARVVHYCLYFILLMMPIAAYIGTAVDIPLLGVVYLSGFFRFEVVEHWIREEVGMLMIAFIEPFATFHKDVGADIILPFLLLGHIGAAVVHLCQQDGMSCNDENR
ncbi:cytochrome b/b6 domain-containing protein [Shewanella woodyi]|uniref:cytochrome b/b6 domain-containing protein n=1 Tax=Shewanella woodyi TaxID=60961 RepID=UPI0007EAB923|nr:cytochrome b/b6 domain-containing protein [Shewanella woodyi]